MAAADATAVPVKNQAFRVTFPILDADGDLVTGAAGLDSEVGIDETTFTDVTAEATELATASGMYRLDLTAAEMNGDTIAIIVKTSTGGAKTTPIVLYPQESGDIKVEVQNIAANAITAAAINAGAITAAKFGAGAIDNAAFNVTETLTANPAAGGITAASFGAGAIDAASLNADAVTKIRSIVNGTADAGGTTTALRDAARTEIDDTFTYCWLLFTSGADQNRVRLITDFLAATDDIVFAPAVSVAVATGVTYEILPAASVDLQSWLGTEGGAVAPSALISGRPDVDVGAMQANVITAAAIAAAAIGVSEAPNLDAAMTTRATPAQVATEILDALNTDTYAEASGVLAATSTLVDRIVWMSTLARNKILQTATVQTLRNDADGADIATAAVSDDATTATRAEWV